MKDLLTIFMSYILFNLWSRRSGTIEYKYEMETSRFLCKIIVNFIDNNSNIKNKVFEKLI